MKRLYALIIAAALCFSPIDAWAWWQSIQQVAIATGGGGFTGLGDLSLSVTIKAYGGFRCYNTAYTGNVASIWDSSTGSTTHTVLTCSAGGTVNETINPLSTTCASGCVVETLYDQSGTLACGGSACNWTQATNANRPLLTTNFSNGRPCLVTTSGSSQTLISPAITTLAQPFSISAVTKRTTVSNFSAILAAPGSNGLLYMNAANQISVFAGSAPTVTMSDSVLHSVQAVFNGASSSALVDTTPNTGLASGSGNISGLTTATGVWSGAVDPINVCEVAAYAGAFSGADQTALQANQHGTDGFNF